MNFFLSQPCAAVPYRKSIRRIVISLSSRQLSLVNPGIADLMTSSIKQSTTNSFQMKQTPSLNSILTFGSAINMYNFSAVQIILEIKAENINRLLLNCRLDSKELLVYINTKSAKLRGRHFNFNNFPLYFQKMRSKWSNLIPSVMSSIKSDDEMKIFGACMLIIMPSSKSLWTIIDDYMSNFISSKEFSLESCLYVAHALMKIREYNRWHHNSFNVGQAINQRIATDPTAENEIKNLSKEI